jgi:zinc and cadmium transporter
MWPVFLIIAYCLLVAAASLAGGTLPALVRLTHTRMQLIMSFVGGLVLGVGLLHLLPHSAAETGSLDQSVYAALAGLLTMFFLIRIFHVHQHGPVGEEHAAEKVMYPEQGDHPHHDEHAHEHRHEHPPHDYPLSGEHCAAHRHAYSWIGLAVGLALHTLIDGMALAASVSAQAKLAPGGLALLGLGTFLAILLHKPLDAMSITTVMAAGGWSTRAQTLVNVIFALMCAAGAAAFWLGVQQAAAHESWLVGMALGFAAGVFLCISLADILPEVQFHTHDRMKLSLALVLGIALAYGIGFVEPAHHHAHSPSAVHSHDHGEPHEHHEDEPGSHDHPHNHGGE